MAAEFDEILNCSARYSRGFMEIRGFRSGTSYHGYECAVCSFNFEQQYGGIGKNYIHIHHIVPLSEIKKEYKLDPIKDLIPVCPNCHAIIHRTQPALTVEELKSHLADNLNNHITKP